MNDITGVDRGDIQEFRGLRYATADRLRAPVDVERWTPGLQATEFGAQAPQISGPLEKLLGTDQAPAAEDCLFLNVFTPSCDDARRPVLLFVHGGAFVTGSGSMPWYDGAPLARRGDVVVVTINYRLGALGFLGDRNLGSLDQIAALRWVHRNIGSFGGDPERVTLFGESAGGTSVLSLLAAPDADGLFRAAWAMSPSILQLRSRARGERMERVYLDQIGEDTVADDLLSMSVEEILNAQDKVLKAHPGLKDFTPAEGTAVFPDPILERVENDERPVVIGTNRDEMLLFTAFDRSRSDWDCDDVEREFTHRFGDGATSAIAAYRRARPDATPSEVVSAMQTDELFRHPAQKLAEGRASNGRSTWMYLFDETSGAFGGVMGSCHGLDIPFAFDTLSARGAGKFIGPVDELAGVAEQFTSTLLGFAHDGDPGWPKFEPPRRATQRIGPTPEIVDDPEPELRRLWASRGSQ